jgi:phosphatidylserine/phosphatidylglycerophosphate/cardiolipin synthase-like enzyme
MQRFLSVFTLLLCVSTTFLSAQTTGIYHILSRDQESLQCRWDLIQQAKHEILLSTYSIHDDAVGLGTLQLLIEAVERGVSVQLLVDAYDNGLPDCLFTYLEEHGVQTKVFNVLNPFKFRTIVDRMHGKMIITDQRTLIVGGRNLTERYYQLDTTINFLDREVYVVSDSAAQHARRHFRELWNNPKLSHQEQGRLSNAQRICWKEALEHGPEIGKKRLQIAPIGLKDWESGAKKTTQPIHFIHDNYIYKHPRKGRYWRANKDQQAARELIALISKAQKTLDIENAYFMPTRQWKKALKACLERGVKVRLLTNSSYTNDLPLVQAIYLNRRAWALRNGIEIWEYQGVKMFHVKAMVIDDHIATIGSYNLDLLSHKYNSEVMVWVNDKRIAAEQDQIMNGVLKKSIRVGGKTKASRKQLPPPTRIQRKRHHQVQWLRYTIAPIVGIIA